MKNIHEAHERIKGKSNQTPVLTSRTLNRKIGAKIFIKAENFQRGGAFKFRGAFNAISQLSSEEKSNGVITHSSGNHAQAVAIAGLELGIKTTIVMPKNAPRVKIDATKGYKANVVLCEPTLEARKKTCDSLIRDHGYTLVHPYDDDAIIAGAGTTAKELIDEVGDLQYLIAPVGGGGLISGCSLFSKMTGKVETVIGAEPTGADDAYRSMKTGNRIKSHTPNTIADGLLTTLSERTFKYIKQNVDKIITVSDDDILQAMKFYFQRMKVVVEPSGAISLAILLSDKILIEKDSKVGAIISGGNIDLTNYFDGILKKK